MRKYIFLSMMTVSSLYAAQILDGHQTERLNASISGNHYNRLRIEGDSIQQVFGNGDLSIEQDEMNGQIFLKPVMVSSSQPFYLSVITEKGSTYDFKFVASHSEPQVLLIKQRHTHNLGVRTKQKSSQDDYTISLKKALSVLIQGQTIEGFLKVNREKPLRKFEGWEIDSFSITVGKSLQTEVYRLKNSTVHSQEVNQSTFPLEGVKAMVVDKEVVKPDGYVTVYLIAQKSIPLNLKSKGEEE